MALQLPATAALEQVSELLTALELEAAAGGEALAIDARALKAFDTSTLALLLHAQRRAKAQGRALQVLGAPAKLLELARLYGVEELLPLASPAA